MTDRYNDNFQMRLQMDSRDVVRRLKRGFLGKHIENVLQQEAVQRYFDEELVQHCAILAKDVPANKRAFFLEVVEPEKLWKNLSINLSNNILTNCMRLWVAEEDMTFDEVIIRFVTTENVKHVIDALKEAFESFAMSLSIGSGKPMYIKDDKHILN